jgi:hypothetical protein
MPLTMPDKRLVSVTACGPVGVGIAIAGDPNFPWAYCQPEFIHVTQASFILLILKSDGLFANHNGLNTQEIGFDGRLDAVWAHHTQAWDPAIDNFEDASFGLHDGERARLNLLELPVKAESRKLYDT